MDVKKRLGPFGIGMPLHRRDIRDPLTGNIKDFKKDAPRLLPFFHKINLVCQYDRFQRSIRPFSHLCEFSLMPRRIKVPPCRSILPQGTPLDSPARQRPKLFLGHSTAQRRKTQIFQVGIQSSYENRLVGLFRAHDGNANSLGPRPSFNDTLPYAFSCSKSIEHPIALNPFVSDSMFSPHETTGKQS